MRLLVCTPDIWRRIIKEWEGILNTHNVDPFEWFSIEQYPALKSLVANPQENDDVYALVNDEGNGQAIFWANLAELPRTEGKTLRIRHIIFSPKWAYSDDKQDKEIELISGLWMELFTEITALAKVEMSAKHVKINLRSPFEALYFLGKLAKLLKQEGIFSDVKQYGRWLEYSF